MSVAVTAIGVYLFIGLLVLILFDLVTRRLRNRLRDASDEAQEKLAESGNFVGRKTSIMLTVLALWLFWPAPICGTLYDWIRGMWKK